MDDGGLRCEVVTVSKVGPPSESSEVAPAQGMAGRLQSIPLVLRMILYGVFFLLAVLAGLPYLAYQFDRFFPAWTIEIGVWRVVGGVFFTVVLALYLWASCLLSRHGRGAYVEFDPPQAFVATGPFRWVRNPIAACVVGMLLGEAILFSSTGIFLLFVLAVPLAHAQVIWLEEPLLKRRFGSAYVEYCARVPRWFPRPPRESGP